MANLDEMELTGIQYYLSSEQSAGLRNVFQIDGIPFYILIDKNGTITETGSHLRPSGMKGKLEELLKKQAGR